MDITQLQNKRREKQDYMEKLKVELNAVAGQIVLLDELIKGYDTVVEESPK